MARVLIIFLLIFLYQETAFCQLRPAIQWQKCLGGTKDDRAQDILINPDSTLIIVGTSRSNDGIVTGHHGSTDSTDVWIVKLSSDGNILWQKSIGGTGNDYFKTVIRTNDNSYLCIGSTRSVNGDVTGNHGNSDVWVVKISNAGDILSSKCYGGSKADSAVQAIRTTDGNYAVMGTSFSYDGDVLSGAPGRTTSDAWAFKINDAGTLLWEKCLDYNNDNDMGYDIIVSEDNNLYALFSGSVNYVGGIFPNEVNLVRHPGKLYKLNSVTGSSSLVGNVYLTGLGDSAYAMCRTSNATRFAVLDETYFYVEFCYDEDFYITTKPDGSVSFSTQHIGGQFTRNCSNAFNDGNYTAPTHGLAAAETSSGIVAAGTYLYRQGWGMQPKGWLSDISGFSAYYTGNSFSTEETHFRSVKVFTGGNEFVVAGYTNDNGVDISGNHGDYDFWVLKLSGLNRVVGTVFIDANNNNIKDPGELPFNHATIKTSKSGFQRTAFPYNGFYDNTVDIGTFTTSININRPYYTATPVSKISVFSTYKNVDTANFAVHPIPGIIDYAVSLNGYPVAVRPGFPCQFNFTYTNRGTATLSNKEVVFIKDSRLQLVNTNPPYSSISGDSIKWNIATLLPEGYGNITVITGIPAIPIINPGDTVFSAIYIDSTSDYNRFDNYIPLRLPVTGSYDPNDKQEIHGGFITPAELASGRWLNYSIRFQNTGNDTAFNIVIKDTLDSKLNWDSIEVTASSHPYQFTIKNNRYINCTFSNIKLADSTHNEPLSHGFISYRIKPVSSLVPGDTIRNSAAIYFDYNPPVATNTQLTIIRDWPVQVQWTGAVSSAWENPLNWNNGKVPDANTNVTINNGAPRYPVVDNVNATCRSLNVKTGASVLVKTGYTLKVFH